MIYMIYKHAGFKRFSAAVLVLPSSCSGWTFLCLEFWCLERPCLDLHGFLHFSHLNPLFEGPSPIFRIKTSTFAVNSSSSQIS